MVAFLALCLVAGVVAKDESPVTKVVTLLQEMLDTSKSDGEADREAYAKFKCYCDTNIEDKTAAIEQATMDIALMTTTLADRRAENTKLSQEVFELKQGMDENEQARSEATAIRDKEKASFEQEESDLSTGVDQLGRAIKLLQAVGADQTQSSSADAEQMMAAAAAAEGSGLLEKHTRLSKISADVQQALKAAAVFLSGQQRSKLSSFLAQKSATTAGAPGNYNAQSGEIVGILKSMNDTFSANLENARAEEAKAVTNFDSFLQVKEEEFDEMKTSSDSKKEVIGNNAQEIATTQSEKDTKEGELSDDQAFVSELTPRCEAKAKEYDHRNNLRSMEEAAVAQAIAILHSDAAAQTFSATGKKPELLQLRAVRRAGGAGVRAAAAAQLAKAAQATKSSRLDRVVAVLSASNPFDEVLAKIRDIIVLIDAEEKNDNDKKAWCETEQSEHEQSKSDKETDVGTLETNLNNLQIAIDQSKANVEQANADLKSNRASQASETELRKESHEVFQTSLSNLQEAEAIVGKAIEVLTKFYKNLKEQQEETAEIAMVARRHKTFMKAQALKHGGKALVQEEPAPPEATFSKGQAESGTKVLELLEHILTETRTEADDSISSEKSAQAQFETNMQALKTAEQSVNEAIEKYTFDLATTERRLEQTHENKDVTKRELEAVERYLATIEPDCTFIISNLQTRTDNRAAEKAALEGAISTLEASPAFQNAEANQEREDLGKCAGICEGKKDTNTAECQACQHGVSVAGWCATNDAPGCADATKTGSAAAMNAPA